MTTATAFETIDVTLDEGVCTITMQRPDVLNAFDNTLTTELAKALKDASRNKEVRVVVITGSGRAFSSGQDLADLKAKYVPGHEPHLGEDLKKRYDPIVTAIHTMEKPVVAAVNGGGDTDTNGAMVGAILGAAYGARKLPKRFLDKVEEAEIIREVGNGLSRLLS